MSTITISNLTELESIPQYSNGIVVINFWASWSPSAIQMSSIFDELSRIYSNIGFIKVEAEESNISSHFNVESVPTFLFFRNGTLISTLNGSNAPELTKRVESLSQQVTPPNSKSPKELLWERLKKLVEEQLVMIFIKGTPTQPKCGFSRKFCEVLDSQNIKYGHFNILSDNEVREGLKELFNWPTFPQLYIKGELIGGLDVVTELIEEGEFAELVKNV